MSDQGDSVNVGKIIGIASGATIGAVALVVIVYLVLSKPRVFIHGRLEDILTEDQNTSFPAQPAKNDPNEQDITTDGLQNNESSKVQVLNEQFVENIKRNREEMSKQVELESSKINRSLTRDEMRERLVQSQGLVDR